MYVCAVCVCTVHYWIEWNEMQMHTISYCKIPKYGVWFNDLMHAAQKLVYK